MVVYVGPSPTIDRPFHAEEPPREPPVVDLRPLPPCSRGASVTSSLRTARRWSWRSSRGRELPAKWRPTSCCSSTMATRRARLSSVNACATLNADLRVVLVQAPSSFGVCTRTTTSGGSSPASAFHSELTITFDVSSSPPSPPAAPPTLPVKASVCAEGVETTPGVA